MAPKIEIYYKLEMYLSWLKDKIGDIQFWLYASDNYEI